MNHLPQYWAVKIDREHPLWEQFREFANKEFPESNFDVEVNDWGYLAKDDDALILNFGIDETSFGPRMPIITLEQFFGTQYEIY